MNHRLIFLLSILSGFTQAQESKVAFREDFREVEAHIPVINEDLTSDFLTLERLGPSSAQLKLSYHPEIPNDPHYVWNGLCEGPTLLAFKFKNPLDLTGKNWVVRLQTKNVGKSQLHLAFQIGNNWFVKQRAVANKDDWNEQSLPLDDSVWLTLNPETIELGGPVDNPDFSKVSAIGFVAPHTPDRSADCTRLDWFELIRLKD